MDVLVLALVAAGFDRFAIDSFDLACVLWDWRLLLVQSDLGTAFDELCSIGGAWRVLKMGFFE